MNALWSPVAPDRPILSRECVHCLHRNLEGLDPLTTGGLPQPAEHTSSIGRSFFSYFWPRWAFRPPGLRESPGGKSKWQPYES